MSSPRERGPAKSVQSAGAERERRPLGIIGFGSFGRFAARYLRDQFDLVVADREPQDSAARAAGVRAASVPEVAALPLVVLAVPVQDLNDVLEEARSHWHPQALVIEVASVKVRPAQRLEAGLPEGRRFVGLHPLFGPQSGRDGIEGLKVVLCESTQTERRAQPGEVACVRSFLLGLGLEVSSMSAERHDREMAYVQGLTHWIAKALREIHLPDLELATPAYRHLLRIEELLREDSLDLFLTIQRENDFSPVARAEFTRRLKEIEQLVRAGD